MSNVNTVWYTETITVFCPSIWGLTVLQKHHNPFRPLPILYNFSCSTNHRIISCRCWTAAIAKKHHTRFFVLNFRYKPKTQIFLWKRHNPSWPFPFVLNFRSQNICITAFLSSALCNLSCKHKRFCRNIFISLSFLSLYYLCLASVFKRNTFSFETLQLFLTLSSVLCLSCKRKLLYGSNITTSHWDSHYNFILSYSNNP
jgi:hypothetical protein